MPSAVPPRAVVIMLLNPNWGGGRGELGSCACCDCGRGFTSLGVTGLCELIGLGWGLVLGVGDSCFVSVVCGAVACARIQAMYSVWLVSVSVVLLYKTPPGGSLAFLFVRGPYAGPTSIVTLMVRPPSAREDGEKVGPGIHRLAGGVPGCCRLQELGVSSHSRESERREQCRIPHR